MATNNPLNLMNPGVDPSSPEAMKVSAPVAITAPLPDKLVDVKYYFYPLHSVSMHRTDGKQLIFLHGICAAYLKADQDYLDNEIVAGNPHLSNATPERIQSYKMKINPKGTIEEEVRKELEPKVRQELEDKIRAEMASKDANKLAGVDEVENKAKALVASTVAGAEGGTKVIMESKPAALGGIVSTTQIAEAAKVNK